ncbi:hypothetical protein RYX36_014830, partial [Vicia faba]
MLIKPILTNSTFHSAATIIHSPITTPPSTSPAGVLFSHLFTLKPSFTIPQIFIYLKPCFFR